MSKGLVDFEWQNIKSFDHSDITYFLFLEGKSVEAISIIRNLDENTIQKHLIEGKIKYRFLEKCSDTRELFDIIYKAVKKDKTLVLERLDNVNRLKLIQFIKDEYASMETRKKECAVWMLGEIKRSEGMDVLIKASVHKHVSIRRMAISALGKLGDAKAEAALMRALEDSNPQVILYAIKSLKKIESKNAFTKIKKISYDTSIDYLKRAALEFLENYQYET